MEYNWSTMEWQCQSSNVQRKIIGIRPPTRGFKVTRGQARSAPALWMYLQCRGRAEIGESKVSLSTISMQGKLMAGAGRKAGMMKPFTATNPYQCVQDSCGITLCADSVYTMYFPFPLCSESS